MNEPWRRRSAIVTPLVSVLVAVLVSVIVLIPLIAEARPGGGQTYGGGGGGGGGGSGGGGGGDGELFLMLIWLAFEHPVIGIPLLLMAGVGYFVVHAAKKRGGGEDWDSGGGGLGFDPGPRQRAPQAKLADLRQIDPDFSTLLFDDFVYRLYASAHEARADATKLGSLAPYLEPAVREGLAARQPSGVPISNVVVGAMRVLRVQLPSWDPSVAQGQLRHPTTDEPETEVEIEFEANVTAATGPAARGFYLWERWLLRRPISVTTPTPERVRSLACPSCGAPFHSADMERCDYCGQVVTDGRFDWRVVAIQELRSQPKPPALTSDIGEAGTSLPTVYDPHLHQAWTSLASADPSLVPGALEQRAQLIYRELNTAWVARDLRSARALLSDGMADYLRYWVEAYKREGLINKLDEMRVTGIQLVKVARDRWYDAVTFRVFASGRDYTVRDTDGQLVSGNPKRDRAYSEYWTLMRGTGVSGAPRDHVGCPNCGAPLAISMGGTCEHCNAHVSSGEFDWVLSKIEQDEVYGG